MKNHLFKRVCQGTTALFVAAIALVSYATPDDLATRISQSSAFGGQLRWVGNKPGDKESEVLWNAINIATNGTSIQRLEAYITDRPDAAWTPSVRHVLAKTYRAQGRYSDALIHWEAAWKKVKSCIAPSEKELGDAILGNWLELLSVLGRSETAKPVIAETVARDFIDPAAKEMYQNAKNSVITMEAYPGIAFRCGTFALAEVGRVLQIPNVENLIDVSSPKAGFNLSELVNLSQQYKMNLVAVRRNESKKLVVPSVVHWRGAHYAAIIKQLEDHYLVSDPTFGEQRWLSETDINKEASGVFLVPAIQRPEKWEPMSVEETGRVIGRGYPNGIKDGDDQGCQKDPTASAESCKPCKGMPQWWVSEPYINLWIGDEPVSYKTSLGEEIAFRLSYKQRDTRPATLGGYSNPVPATTWNHNWFSYVHIHKTTTTYASPPTQLTPFQATVYLPNGGERFFSMGVAEHEQSRSRIEPMDGSPIANLTLQKDDGIKGLRLINSDGSQYIYGYVAERFLDATWKAHAVALMTHHIDASGNTNSFIYENVSLKWRLKYMVDYNGKTNTLRYSADYLLSEVENPHGHKAQFKYDANKNLTNITDAVGLSSSISYSNSEPIALVTPYGTNTFTYTVNTVGTDGSSDTNNFGGHNNINRAIRITEPNGGNQLFMYRFDSTNLLTNTYAFPTGTPMGTLDDGRGSAEYRGMTFRNSFHWNQKQYGLLSTETLTGLTFNDYLVGHRKHWLADSNNLRVTGLISMEREASPDGTIEGQYTWYDYEGKNTNSTYKESVNSLLSVVARIMPNGETQYIWTRKNQSAYPTNIVSTYSLLSGVATRTNILVYATNVTTYIAYEMGGSGYKNTNYFTNFNLLTSVTNWNGESVGSYGEFPEYSSSRVVTNSGVVITNTLRGKRLTPGVRTNAINEITRYTYGPAGAISGIRKTSGLLVTNVFDSVGFVTTNSSVVDALVPGANATHRFSYANGSVYKWTNELGLVRTYSWDGLVRATNIAFPEGSNIEVRYKNLDVSGIKNREGQWRYFGYNSMAQLTAVTNELGKITKFGYCGCGSLETITNALDEVTTFFYDNQLRLSSVLYPDFSGVVQNYDLLGRVTNVIDTSGASLTNWFNNQGLLFLSSNSIGRVRSVTYDKLDRAIQTIGGNGVLVTNSFDLLDRLLTRTYPDGGVEKFAYSTNGLVAYTNQLGHISRFVNDAAYRTLYVTNANTELVQLKYDPASNLTNLIDARTKSTRWKFDEFSRLIEKRDHTGITNFVYSYNRNGWLTNRWTPGKANVGYSYDPVGNVTNVDYLVSADLRFQYDALSRVTNMVTVGQFTNRFGYTSFGAIASEDGSWESDTITYSYTDQLLTGVSMLQPSASPWTQNYGYDAADRLKTISGSGGDYVYDYDSVRKWLVNKIALPNTSYITNTFDSVARLNGTWLKNSGHTNLNYHTYGINTGGQRASQERMGGNYVDYTYDLIGQLKTALGKEANTAPRLQEQFGYKYDAAGNLSHRTNNALVQTFNANDLNQLTTATRAGALTVAGAATSTATNVTVNTVYKADLYSDKTFASTNTFALVNGDNTFSATATDAEGRTSTKSVTFNLPATVGFNYDANGNLTNDGNRVLEFDDENQLTRITVLTNWKAEFAYDGFMRRVVRKDYAWSGGSWNKTNEVRYVYDGMLVVQERETNNAPRVTYTRGLDLSGAYEGAGGIGGLLGRTDHASGRTGFYHADGNGNVTALVNQQEVVAARYVYDPFGNTLAASGPLAQANTMRFSSKEIHAPSGLYSYGYRFYDPNLQRWINRDPIGERGGVNLYGMGGDFINRIDPMGEIIVFGHRFFEDPTWMDQGGDLHYDTPPSQRPDAPTQDEEDLTNADGLFARERAHSMFEGQETWQKTKDAAENEMTSAAAMGAAGKLLGAVKCFKNPKALSEGADVAEDLKETALNARKSSKEAAKEAFRGEAGDLPKKILRDRNTGKKVGVGAGKASYRPKGNGEYSVTPQSGKASKVQHFKP